MNIKKTPAYIVYHNDQINPPTETLFAHVDLLTARKAAMSCAELLFGSYTNLSKSEQVEVHLVEVEQNQSVHLKIARVIQRYSTQTGPVIGIDAIPVDLIEDIQLRYLQILHELDKELHYYTTHRHSNGFGSFAITLNGNDKVEVPASWTILFDAMSYALAAIGSYFSHVGEPAKDDLFSTHTSLYYPPLLME